MGKKPHRKSLGSVSPAGAAIRLRVIGSIAIVVLWAALYLPNLGTSPAWYGDEFVTLNAGDSILEGTFDNRALKHSFFSVYTNYQPVSCLIYAFAARTLSPGNIWGARFVSTLFALAVAQVCFHLFFRRGRFLLGLSAALIFLSAPQALIHYRWIYPHLFLSLGVLVAALLLDMRRTKARDWTIGLGCALGATAHLLAGHVTAFALLLRVRHPSSWLRIGIPPAVVFVSALLFGYLISGDQLFKDLAEVGSTYSTHPSPPRLIDKVRLFFTFFTWDWFHVFALAGLVAMAIMRRWMLFLFTMMISFVIIQNRPELTTFYYQASIFLPLLAVGQAFAVRLAAKLLSQRFAWLQSRRWLVRGLTLAVSCLFLPLSLKNSWSGDIIPRCERVTTPEHQDITAAAKWVNDHIKPDDLVVSYWDTGYFLKGRWMDIMQASVWEYGTCPAFYMRPRSHDEFRFPADVRLARYIIVGQLDLKFAFVFGTAPQLIKDAQIESWPVVWRSQTVLILENPKMRPANAPLKMDLSAPAPALPADR